MFTHMIQYAFTYTHIYKYMLYSPWGGRKAKSFCRLGCEFPAHQVTHMFTPIPAMLIHECIWVCHTIHVYTRVHT